jgi:hypothetical protein
MPVEATIDQRLRAAVLGKRIMTFTLHGLPRRAEPHDYGLIDGVPKLFFYQIGGRSRTGTPIGWRWAVVSEMRNIEVLNDPFAGARETPSGRHVHWDLLIASVSRPT